MLPGRCSLILFQWRTARAFARLQRRGEALARRERVAMARRAELDKQAAEFTNAEDKLSAEAHLRIFTELVHKLVVLDGTLAAIAAERKAILDALAGLVDSTQRTNSET